MGERYMPNGILRLVAVYKQILFYILVNLKKKIGPQDLDLLIFWWNTVGHTEPKQSNFCWYLKIAIL